jgi:hypothetical protein
VISVPRGGSAAFLAPQPLSLLAIAPEVQHMLEAVGVRTLGEFVALPPPSVTRPWDADLQALARGDGGGSLARFAPAGTIVERLSLGVASELGLGVAVALLAARVAARLAGRGRSAARIELRAVTTAGPRSLELAPPVPLSGADDLADVLGTALSGVGTVVELELEVVIETALDGSAVEVAPAEQALALAPAPAPTLAEAFRLDAPALGAMAREPHRRTRRGKQRSRVVPAAQSRLFAGT